MRIAHLTSVHGRYDIRIFLKMCRSLARHGHEVSLVVADGKGDEECEGVRIIDVGAATGRLDRMARAPSRILAAAAKLNADVFHLHDPELLSIALRLKRLGRRVIFDSHEDYPASILTKSYLPAAGRPAISAIAKQYERHVVQQLDFVIAATPAIRGKFERIGCRARDVNNYPLLDELASDLPWGGRRGEICYVGGIAPLRGIHRVVAAMAAVRTDARLNLVGRFSDAATRKMATVSPGWSRVNELGQLGREEVRAVLARSVAGVVTFLPAPNHLDAQPNKMFEYMSSGLPVISSNFPLWREIIEGADCGVCVDPLDPASIAEAIDALIQHPARAEQMGRNGRRAVVSKYNWEIEETKLLDVYQNVLSSN